MGLPEIKLGIFPGFGGTQRLPRLIGLLKSLDIMLTGSNIDARKAFKYGIVDDCVPDYKLEEHKNRWIEKILKSDSQRPFKMGLLDKLAGLSLVRNFILNQAEKKVKSKSGTHYPAPFALIEVLRKTYNTMPTESGLHIEREKFTELVIGEVCKNLIRLFFINERIKKDYKSETDLPEIKNIGILGAGVMGGGIAWLFAKSDFNVRLKDISLEAIGLGWKQVWANFKSLLKRKKIKMHQLNKGLGNITHSLNFNGFDNLDIIVEAVVEDLEVKKKVVKDLESRVKHGTIIVTNTSSLCVSDIAHSLYKKANFLGMHFFNPVALMPLVEVVATEDTDKSAVNAVVDLARKCGKVPIVVKDCSGFVVNRLLLPYMNEAVLCLQDIGVNEENIRLIDKIFTDYGMPMGPFRLADEVGLDVCYKVSKNLETAYGERMKTAQLLGFIYKDLGLLGKKNLKGFYEYDSKGKITGVNSNVRNKLISSRFSLSSEEIVQRCMFLMANEAFKVIDESVIKDEEYLDLALIMGMGFPASKGGLISYIQSVGLERVGKKLLEFRDKYGERFQPNIKFLPN
jgi:3-hydroxyacyl-CoA dehydrogenase/enoyl-CoA hydratase/3-hydroxybutyryl-CoA epimerase